MTAVNATARAILDHFEGYMARFDEVTARAEQHFATGDWQHSQVDARARLELYPRLVDACLADVKQRLGANMRDRATWVGTRGAYAELIESAPNVGLAETWFNSLTRKVWDTVGVDPDIDFIRPSGRLPNEDLKVRSVAGEEATSLVRSSIQVVAPAGPWQDLASDVELATRRLAQSVGDLTGARIDMVPAPFYRGRACYLVGRIAMRARVSPLIYSIRNADGKMVVDAVITDEDRVSILFSFTRSYFHVRTPEPAKLVGFLRSIMPQKRIAELFISIGFNKHGKTELYRDLLDHLADTDAQFEVAPGQRGLVMSVFAMPDYDIVFKIIKDSFPPPKRTTRNQIREKYRLVFEHDRAGRLVEAHEFDHLSLARSRFAPSLLQTLADEAARTVRVEGERVVIEHAYLERRVTPLDLYVRERPPDAAVAAIIDYGDAIRDLMASDIFPGDMLLKNFGVTRHGRVVFYDYDELTRMGDCTFRQIPDAPTIDDAMSNTPWFSVAEADVFPEEFPRFMGLPADVRAEFHKVHGDLFDHRTWQGCQERILNGEVIEIFPYPPSYQLRP